MLEEQLKAFLEKVNGDTNLLGKLKAADDDAVVSIAKEAGFRISADDLINAPKVFSYQAEISDVELEGVAGGGWACKAFLFSISDYNDNKRNSAPC